MRWTASCGTVAVIVIARSQQTLRSPSLFSRMSISRSSFAPDDAVRQLSRGTCVALVEHYFFANARQHLIAEGKIGNHGEARHWQDADRTSHSACH